MTQVNPAELAFAAWQADEEKYRQREVVTARAYYEGALVVWATERIKNLLGLQASADVKMKVNIIRPIVNALVERMAVKGFRVTVPTAEAGDDEGRSDAAVAVRAWAERVWKLNAMDIKQDDIAIDTANEGEAFVIVDWDERNTRPRFTPHPRYTDPTVSSTQAGDGKNPRETGEGDGFGCKVFYENDDPNQGVIRASKRWREELGAGKSRLRLTEYYPDRIEKYLVEGPKLTPIRDEGDATWPLSWVDGAGEPLGVPVFHATAPDTRPGAIDAWGVQDAIVQAFIDLLAGNRIAAFRIFKAFGFYPTTDGLDPKADRSNWLNLEPGAIIGTRMKGPNDAAFEPIDGASPAAFLDTLDKLIYYAATTTDTPLSRFQMTGQVASEATQKEYKEPLMARIMRLQARIGAMWSQAFTMALKLERLYGDSSLAENAIFETQWQPLEKRSIEDLGKEAAAKKASGVPEETIWREVWGYSEEQIAAMKREQSYMQRQAIAQMALGAQNINNG
jgi:hypothetical protein